MPPNLETKLKIQCGCQAAIFPNGITKIDMLQPIRTGNVQSNQGQTKARVWKPKNPIWPSGGHFVKVTSLEINRLLIHTQRYRKSHCEDHTILRPSYLSIIGFPILLRYIYIESGPWPDFLIETMTAGNAQQLPCKLVIRQCHYHF